MMLSLTYSKIGKMRIKNLLEERLDRIAMIIGATGNKILKKELKNFKKDVIKLMLKHGNK